MDDVPDPRLRALPQLQKLLDLPAGQRLIAEHGHAPVVASLRAALEQARSGLRTGASAAAVDPIGLIEIAAAALEQDRQPVLGRVINATGIVLHTNLGRAKLADAAVAASIAASGYCNLEFDLATGGRGSRVAGISPLLRQITGAEAAIAVNNGAAAVLLALSALADGAEVIVSRGELVEIGGGFRIPDVIQQGGARLIEVGTTNKTRLADYERAITPATKILLKVHQSNFRVSGFTEETSLAQLSSLARARGLLVVHDLGSGTLVDLASLGLPAETMAQDSIAAGVDVVAFSGDKLLGGPQAGILAGRSEVISRLSKHPLMRALRLDKVTLAALEATLRLHATGRSADIPALRMMGQSQAVLRARAESLAGLIGGDTMIVASAGFAGGGTMPDAPIASLALRLGGLSAEALKARLRAARPPVIARIEDGAVLLDMLTVEDSEISDLAAIVREALAA